MFGRSEKRTTLLETILGLLEFDLKLCSTFYIKYINHYSEYLVNQV